jgi:hypothetical protein
MLQRWRQSTKHRRDQNPLPQSPKVLNQQVKSFHLQKSRIGRTARAFSCSETPIKYYANAAATDSLSPYLCASAAICARSDGPIPTWPFRKTHSCSANPCLARQSHTNYPNPPARRRLIRSPSRPQHGPCPVFPAAAVPESRCRCMLQLAMRSHILCCKVKSCPVFGILCLNLGSSVEE